MAELLIYAKKHWMDDFTQEQIDKMAPNELQSFNARVQKGDIVVVRPDGWQWGKEECLPNFLVVKMPGVAVSAVKKYENSLMGNVDKEFYLRVEKGVWEDKEKQAELFLGMTLKTTPVAIPQEDGSYLVMGTKEEMAAIKFRKYQMPPTAVSAKADISQTITVFPTAIKQMNYMNSITEKTS